MKNSIQNIVKITLLFSLFLTLFSAHAQAPQKMSYQAVIRNASNALVVNTNIGMRISILQNSAIGTAVYSETQTITTDSNGLVTLQIGNGTVMTGIFATINWSSGIYFIKTETDPSGGTNYSIVGSNQLLSVPYALSSADNKWTTNGAAISNNNSGHVGIGTATPATPLTVKSNTPNVATFDGGNSMWVTLAENGVNRGYVGSYAGNPEDVELGTYGSNATGSTHLSTINVPRLTAKSNGDIGIGTTTPQKYGYPTTDKVLEIKNQLSSNNSQPHLILSTNGTTGSAGTISWADNTAFEEKKMASIGGLIDDGSLFGQYNSRLGFSTREPNGQLTEKFGISGNGSLIINGNKGVKGQVLTSNGPNFGASWSSVGTIIKAVQGNFSSLNLSGFNTVDLPDSHIGFTTTVPVRVILNYETTTSKPCSIGSCNTKWELQVFQGGIIKTFGIVGANYSGDSVPTSASIGPHIVDLQPGQHTFQFKAKNIFNDPQVGFRAYAIIIPQ
ncbi:hypothetical protein [Flavobacterium sp.]|uniref:hypothetical protein n=1 Tax=Flavobacterium sp. TaxID=239 RepID=UPI00286E2E8C|nr:hypothetical protein [Flavobacterium sp.]